MSVLTRDYTENAIVIYDIPLMRSKSHQLGQRSGKSDQFTGQNTFEGGLTNLGTIGYSNLTTDRR
jgi:hypothetical protein